MFHQLHQILLACEFRYVRTQEIPQDIPLLRLDKSKGFYVKTYETTDGDFEIILSFNGDPHTELPWAYVLKSPEKFEGLLLPHINMGWYLCYVDEMEANWDPNDIQATYQAVDSQIQFTLQKSVASVQEGVREDLELEGEFASYWLGKKNVYLLSEATEARLQRCYVAVGEDGGQSRVGEDLSKEWIVFNKNNEHERQNWLSQRKLKIKDDKGFLTGHFKIKPRKLAGVLWPPKNFAEIIKWLTNVDPSARNHIIDYFAKSQEKRHVLLLEVYGQDIVGLYLELNLNATGLNTYGKKRKVKHQNLAAILSSKFAFDEFTRLGVTKADRKTVLSRNQTRSGIGNLGDKKIAVIGCGTIGGYLSGLLVRAGAGCGNGQLHLYDHDTFKAQNFGRHSLTTAEIGKNKAKALADSLISSTHLANNKKIEGKPIRFPIPSQLPKYDVIIDVTGRPPLSKRLARTVREMDADKRPLLIHGFNDGNGRASKVLVDDGNSCYGCMLADPAFYKKEVDLRFKDIDQKLERSVSCGSTYTPYDAAVSVITASILQEAVLNSLESDFPWTYSEHMLDGSRSRKPYRLPNQINCEICNVQFRTDV